MRTCWNQSGSELFIPCDGYILLVDVEGWQEKQRIGVPSSQLDLYCSVTLFKDYLACFTEKDKLICFDLSSYKPIHEQDIKIVRLSYAFRRLSCFLGNKETFGKGSTSDFACIC
jgi:hypothetical protein